MSLSHPAKRVPQDASGHRAKPRPARRVPRIVTCLYVERHGSRHAAGIVATLDKLATEIGQGGGFGTTTTDKDRADILLGFHFRKPVASADQSEVCEKDAEAAGTKAVSSVG